MNKLVYKNFVWPQNPERYQQDYDAAIELILREYHQSETDLAGE